MGKIVVFDSGLGSLSIINAIRQTTKTEIIYFADQKNYPYGKKTPQQLRKIIEQTIQSLHKKFNPDLIIIGSNTPTLLFPDLFVKNKTIIGVTPPLKDAERKSKTKSIAILGTTTAITNNKINHYIKNNTAKKTLVTKIDVSNLIDLVEKGIFIRDKSICKKIIKKTLSAIFVRNNIDVATLSSTHLPFLLCYLQKIFPKVIFLDPAMQVATQIRKNKFFTVSNKNKLTVFCSGNVNTLQKNLKQLRFKHKVYQLKF